MSELERKCRSRAGFLNNYAFGVRYEVFKRYRGEPDFNLRATDLLPPPPKADLDEVSGGLWRRGKGGLEVRVLKRKGARQRGGVVSLRWKEGYLLPPPPKADVDEDSPPVQWSATCPLNSSIWSILKNFLNLRCILTGF
jgi:hypothetical protein